MNDVVIKVDKHQLSFKFSMYQNQEYDQICLYMIFFSLWSNALTENGILCLCSIKK